MRPDSRDMTIDNVLSDPLIRAVMAADRVDTRDLERLLRSAAGRLEPRRATPPAPAFRLAERSCLSALGLCTA